MRDHLQFYIDGAWITPSSDAQLDVINPATEAVAGHIAPGNAQHADKAVMVARRAFGSWSLSRGNGRKWGELGFHDFLETRAVPGVAPA